MQGLEHLVPAGAPGSVGVHFPNAVGAGPGVGAFSTASPVYGVHGMCFFFFALFFSISFFFFFTYTTRTI